jgi:hypothetical protein
MISLRALDSAMPPNRKIDNVERAIYLIRGQRIMLDSDLAAAIVANAQLASKLEELERRLHSHDEAIVDRFATLRRLLEPAEPTTRREIDFHVRERSARYRTKRRF